MAAFKFLAEGVIKGKFGEVRALEGEPFLRAGLLFLALLMVGAGSVVQMPLAGDAGVLEVVGPGADLPGDAFGQGMQFQDPEFQILQRGAAGEEVQHGTDLAGAATGDVEELQQFRGGATLETFGDVVGDGEGGAVKLVLFSPADPPACDQEEILTPFGEPEGVLPDRKVLEALIGGHEDREFEI